MEGKKILLEPTIEDQFDYDQKKELAMHSFISKMIDEMANTYELKFYIYVDDNLNVATIVDSGIRANDFKPFEIKIYEFLPSSVNRKIWYYRLISYYDFYTGDEAIDKINGFKTNFKEVKWR